MWNQSHGDEFEAGNEAAEYAAPPQPPPAPVAAAANVLAEVTWTADQLQRMEGEWRRLQRAFAYHPHVTLTPLRDDPPSAYQIDYRLTTLIVNPRSNQLEYVNNATVQVILPPGFPNDAPVVRPITPIFHPNVSYEGVYVEGLWHPNETLLGLIRKVGDILAYRSYDPDYTVNPAAYEWLAANQESLPIDQQANLAPTAGGEPLARICKYGPQSLDSMKQSIVQTQTALLGATPPEPQTVREYSNKTRLALNLFLEKDVPEEVQALASELELAARELVDLLPLCAFIRERKRRVTALRQASRQLQNLRDPLLADIDKLVGLVEAGDPTEPMVALKLIPEIAKLQPLQMSLPKLIGEAEQRVTAIKAGLALFDGPDAQPSMIPPDSMLGKRLERELTTTGTDVDATRQEATAALAECEPVLQRATIEAVSLDFVTRWREYMDMATRAKMMERQIREWGAEGLQAYYISNDGGRYGPFQFEQSVDLGTGDLVLRCLGGKHIELRDPRTDKVLGESKNGSLIVKLTAPPSPESGFDAEAPQAFPTQFMITERCDDLVVLLEFLRRSTIETVQKFATYKGTAESWAGKVCRLLARAEVKKALEDELARAARRWRHTIVDLAALGPWKERLSTYFLLHRCSETIPQLVGTIQDRKKAHAASKTRLNEIMSRCSRDMETGRMIVPPRLSKQYNEELALQEECVATVKKSTALLKSLIAQLTNRLKNPKLLGKDTKPAQLRAVPPLSEALATLPVTDGTLGNLAAPLEVMIQMPLGAPPPQADEVPAEAPAAEAEQAYTETAEGYEQPAEADEGYAGEAPAEGYAESAETYVEEAPAAGQPAEGYAQSVEGYAAEGQEIATTGEVYAGEGGIVFEEADGQAVPAAAAEETAVSPAAAAEAKHEQPAPHPPSTASKPAAAPSAAAPAAPPRVAPAAAPLPAAAKPAPNGEPHAAAEPPVVDDDWIVHSEESEKTGEVGSYDDQSHHDDLVFGFEEEPPSPPAAVPPSDPSGKKK